MLLLSNSESAMGRSWGALEFEVTFAPHNGATIDPSKVRVTI